MAKRNWSWRNITKKPLGTAELVRIYRSFEKSPDRVVAIMAASLVERSLEKGIAKRLRALPRPKHRELFDAGPLRDFSAKIKIGHALSIYGDATYAELNRVREIRNVFAHSAHQVTFDTSRVAQACAKLVLPQQKPWPAIYITLGWLGLHCTRAEIDGLRPPPTARQRYIYVCAIFELMIGATEGPRPQRPRDGITRRLLS